jgi:hypothetical protein
VKQILHVIYFWTGVLIVAGIAVVLATLSIFWAIERVNQLGY